MAVPQLQLANLGEIFAQNQARQASMDNLMLQQQAALEQRQAQQAAAQREAAIRQAIANGVDPSTREGLGQLLKAGASLEQYQSGLLAQARGEAAQAQAQGALMRGQAAQQTANTRAWQAQQQVALSRAQEARMAASAKKEWGKVGFEMAQKLSQTLMGAPEDQRPGLYFQMKQQYGNLAPQLFEDEAYSPEMGQVAQALANSAQSKSTGKPVAVIDPNSGQAVYVAPEQAIGKQVASTRTPGQTEEAKQRQKAIVKSETERTENAANAANIIDSLNRAEQLVTSGAATTGPYISKLPTLSAGTAEFEAISNQLGLEGTKLLKGAISEKENQKVQSTQPGNDRTPESNLAIIQFNRSIMQRTVERAKFDSAWRQTKGTIEGADAAWRRFTQENPVTSSDPNDLSINEQNIGNWQGYITGEGKQAQPTPSGGGQGGVISFEEFMSQ